MKNEQEKISGADAAAGATAGQAVHASQLSHAAPTPGPWRVKTIQHGNEIVGYNVDAESHDPAHNSEYPYFCIERRANAHLISAAPDLYEALKDYHEIIEALNLTVYDEDCDDLCGHDVCREFGCESMKIRRARAAIAKAEGK